MRCLVMYFSLIVLWPLFSCSQAKDSATFDESNYTKVRQGADSDYPHVIFYHYKKDTNYGLRKVFFDTAYTQLFSKCFFYRNIPEGPFFTYVNGSISRKGYYKKGRSDGERITYRNSKIAQKAYFREGIKMGTWEEYDNGKLIKKTVYDVNGNLVEEIKY